MTIAKILQWPFDYVWPLLFQRGERARKLAREIAQAGEFRIDSVKQHVGYVTLSVYSLTADRKWNINIRPVHFGSSGPVFDFNMLRYIEFEYCAKEIADRHTWDPSTYLTIKSVR